MSVIAMNGVDVDVAGLSKPIPTRQAVEKLKKDWVSDDIWDLEDTEGFEAYRDELKAFSDAQKAVWRAEREMAKAAEEKRLEREASKLGCSVAVVRLLEAQTRRIEVQERKLGGYSY